MAKIKYKIKGNNKYLVHYPFATDQDTILREHYGLTPEVDLGVYLIQRQGRELKSILASMYQAKNPADVSIISDVEAEEDATLPDKPI